MILCNIVVTRRLFRRNHVFYNLCALDTEARRRTRCPRPPRLWCSPCTCNIYYAYMYIYIIYIYVYYDVDLEPFGHDSSQTKKIPPLQVWGLDICSIFLSFTLFYLGGRLTRGSKAFLVTSKHKRACSDWRYIPPHFLSPRRGVRSPW